MTEPPQIILPYSTIDELASLGRALTNFAEKLKNAQRAPKTDTPLDDAQFIQETKEMRQAFSDLNEEQLDTLIDNAVQAVRKAAP